MNKKTFKLQPPRFEIDNCIYFLTFITHHRRKILHFHDIPLFIIDNLKYYENDTVKLHSYTVMPEHIHLILEVKTVKDMTDYLRKFKTYTSKKIKQMVYERDAATSRILHEEDYATSSRILHVWQRGTMDHCIRNDNDYEIHTNYLFYNSMKHLNIKPRDYKYHNFLEYVNNGYYEIDFCEFYDKDSEFINLYE